MKEISTYVKRRTYWCCLSLMFFLISSVSFGQTEAKAVAINKDGPTLSNQNVTNNPPLTFYSIDEDCSQITEGNDVENGFGNLHTLIYANDIALNPGQSFSLDSIEVNILMEANIDVDSADIYIYEDSDDGNGPGTEIYSFTGLTPTSSDYQEEAFGFDVDKVTFTFDDPVELLGSSTGKIYWLGMTIESAGESAYMEITSITNTPNEIYYYHTDNQEWISSAEPNADNGGLGFGQHADGVISFYGQCEDLETCDELDDIEIVQGDEMELCENSSFTLTTSMDSEASGLVFQWQQKDPEDDDWTDIEDANDATYSSNGLTEDTDYRIKVECEASGDEIFSDAISVTIKPAAECYCVPAGTNSSYYINNFTTTDAIENINNTSTGFSSGGYGDFTEFSVAQEKTGTVNFSADISGGTGGFRIWVDWNRDGEFSSDEIVYQSSSYLSSHSGSFIVPETAMSGETRMRIVSHWLSTNADIDPCSTSHTYGEFEDYTFDVIELEDCEGDLSAGTPDEDSIEICAGIGFVLSVSDASGAANNLERKWQSSPAGEDDWTDIDGSASSTLNYSSGVMEDTDFRYVLNCNETDDVISDIIEVTLKPGNECYCTPIYTSSCSSNDLISNVSLTGESEVLDNDSGCSSGNYGDYTDLTPPDLAPGETYTISVSTIYSSPTFEDVRAWIDYDHNGIFDDSEEIANTNGAGLSSSGTSEFEFTVPEEVEPGNYRLRVRLVYSGGANIDPCSSVSYGETEDYTVEIIELDDCVDPVTAGTIEDDFEICAGNPFSISVEGASDPANGLVRQWQFSPAGEDDWTNIEGAHSNTYNITDGVMEDTDYRYSVTCNDEDPEYSDVLQVALKPGNECYCQPPTPSFTDLYWIESVNTDNAIQDINNSNTGMADDGYIDYSDIHTVIAEPGGSFDIEVQAQTGASPGLKIWIDWDQNGSFEDEGELVYETTSGTTSTLNTYTATIEVPSDASGTTRMRIRNYIGAEPCNQLSYGETEDYSVQMAILDDCTEAIAGTVSVNDPEVCAGGTVTLSVSGNSEPADGLTRTWQSSPAGEDDWTDLNSGSVNYNVVVTEDTDYRYYVSCTYSDESDISDVVSVTLKPGYECYCTPTYTSGCSSDLISNVSLTGESNVIDNDSGCSPGSYGDYTDLTPADLAPGETYTISISTTYGSPTFEDVRAWIDYNKNGLFEDSEEIANTNGNGLSSSGTSTFDFTVPDDVEPGDVRMRVRMVYSSSNIQPCGSASFGETEDYTVSIIELDDCEGPVSAGTIADDFEVCAGSPFVISVSEPSDPANGLLRQWQSSPAGEDDWTDIEGAHSNSFTIADGIQETMDYRYVVTCNDDESDTSDVLTVDLKPAVECYCIPQNTSNSSYYISNVSTDGALQDIDNTTTFSDNGYGDFTESHVIIVYPGQIIDYSITGNNSSMRYEGWLDLNQNGNFDDDSEHIISSNGYTAAPYTGSLEIPTDMEEGSYRLRVRASWLSTLTPCNNESYGETEDYTLQVIFPECFPPLDIEINYITDNSAQVSWDGSDESEWEVIYGETGFDPETEGTSIIVDEPMVDLIDLDDDTNYQVYVRTICDTENSVWIGPKSFTTNITPPENTRLCDAIELTPNSGCIGGPYTNVAAFEEANEPIGSCLNDFRGTNTVWFTFVATDTEAIVTTDFNSTDFLTEVVVFEAPEDCSDVTTLGDEIGCANASTEGTVYLDGLTIGDTYYVKVGGFNQAEGLFCLEVQMDESEACLDPTDISVDDIQDVYVDISWTSTGSAAQWEVLYGLQGFDTETEGESMIVNQTQATLINLEPETDYDVYVRAICGDDFSGWAGPEGFLTKELGVDNQIFQDFSFYPNPVKDVLNLQAGNQIEKVEIYNLLGQKVLEVSPNALETTIDTDRLQSGTYLMNVSIDGYRNSYQLIKK